MTTVNDIICPLCGESGTVEFVTRSETVKVRGEDITVSKVLRKCGACGEEYENTKDHDWKREAFDKYRVIANIPSSSDIKDWRDKFNLTQAEVSSLLGWGEATIGRYEKGSLPTAAQAEQLKGIMSEENLLKLLEDKPNSVSEEKREALINALKPAALQSRYLNIIEDIYFTSNASLNGGSAFSFEKVAALVGILCARNETKTKLNKLLFYADFIAKKCMGYSITGIQYARITYGPVPDRYETLYESLSALEVINVEDTFIYGNSSKIISPGDKSYDGCLNDDEVAIANSVREYFSTFNAANIVDYSHKEKAWIEVDNGSKIPYDYAEFIIEVDKIINCT